jgi:flagellar hook-length control protein FliK
MDDGSFKVAMPVDGNGVAPVVNAPQSSAIAEGEDSEFFQYMLAQFAALAPQIGEDGTVPVVSAELPRTGVEGVSSDALPTTTDGTIVPGTDSATSVMPYFVSAPLVDQGSILPQGTEMAQTPVAVVSDIVQGTLPSVDAGVSTMTSDVASTTVSASVSETSLPLPVVSQGQGNQGSADLSQNAQVVTTELGNGSSVSGDSSSQTIDSTMLTSEGNFLQEGVSTATNPSEAFAKLSQSEVTTNEQMVKPVIPSASSQNGVVVSSEPAPVQQVEGSLKSEIDIKRAQMLQANNAEGQQVQYQSSDDSFMLDAVKKSDDVLYNLSGELEKLKLQDKTKEAVTVPDMTSAIMPKTTADDMNSTVTQTQQSNDGSLSQNSMGTSTGNQGSSTSLSQGSDFTQVLSDVKESRPELRLDERIRQIGEVQAVAQQIIKAANLRQGNDFSELTVKLQPEYLGSLNINVTVNQDTVCAKIGTDNVYSRELLASNVGALKESLNNAGINVDTIEISMDEQSNDAGNLENQNDASKDQQSTGKGFNLAGYENGSFESMFAQMSSSQGVMNELYNVNYLA